MQGWKIVVTPLNGDAPYTSPLTRVPSSRAYCKVTKHNAEHSIYFANQENELSIEPWGGWESIEGDPLEAIVYAVAEGDIAPGLAVKRIKKLYPIEPLDPGLVNEWDAHNRERIAG